MNECGTFCRWPTKKESLIGMVTLSSRARSKSFVPGALCFEAFVLEDAGSGTTYGMASKKIHAKAKTNFPHGKLIFGSGICSGKAQPPQYLSAPFFTHRGSCFGLVRAMENDPAT